MSNTIGANTSACPFTTTTYTVLACCLSTGCCDTASVTITVVPIPTVGPMSPVSICAGQSATLCASGGVNYSWNTGATIGCITVSPTTTTIYCVTGTDANGCSNTSCATATVSTCTGVNETNFSNQINIYPNPFSQSAAIRIDDSQLIPSEFIMYDLLGKEVKSFLIQNAETIIARDKLSTGLYYYHLMQKEQIIDRGKIMIE
ncbi:MAG: T9SS type A sorting domain-containing protein [Bacteroidota bacterium]